MRKLRDRERSGLFKYLQRDGSRGGGTWSQVWLTQVWAAFPRGQQFNKAKLIIYAFSGWEGLGRWEHPCNEWQEFLKKSTVSLMEIPSPKAVLKTVIMSICKWFGVKRTSMVRPLKKGQASGLHCLESVSITYQAYFGGGVLWEIKMLFWLLIQIYLHRELIMTENMENGGQSLSEANLMGGLVGLVGRAYDSGSQDCELKPYVGCRDY